MGNDQKNLVMAIVLSTIILVGWQFFFSPKPIPTTPASSVSHTATEPQTQSVAGQDLTKPSGVMPSNSLPVEEIFMFKAEKYSLWIKSNLSIGFSENAQSSQKFEDIIGSAGEIVISTELDGVIKKLNLKQVSATEAELVLADEGLGITVTIMNSDHNFPRFSLKSKTPRKFYIDFRYGQIAQDNTHRKTFVHYEESLTKTELLTDDDYKGQYKWFGLDYNHNLLGISFYKSEKGEFGIIKLDAKSASIGLTKPTQDISFDLLLTSKNYDVLKSFGNNLHNAVDFGMLHFFAVPILRALQYSYALFPNYGIAIILLTILIRILTLPLQMSSMKSLKKMQEVGPELGKIKEKYKDDQLAQQRETMDLFKKKGVNPFGGCLPMLAQMPIFFAFYTVLSESVELVGAPFYFWIVDLSAKDPFYVFPIAVCLIMLVQQKVTPSASMDPLQRKMMYLMPLVFSFIMKDLPAGLNLYMIVNTLLGVTQQFVFMKKK